MSNEDYEYFKGLGFKDSTAKEASRAPKLSHSLKDAIALIGNASARFEDSKGVLLYNSLGRMPSIARDDQKKLLFIYIANGKIVNDTQLTAALEYIKSNPGSSLDVKSFEAAAGVGVVVTAEQIGSFFKSAFEARKEELLKLRYTYLFQPILASARSDSLIKWADGKLLKEEFDRQTLAFLGPKTAADEEAIKNAAKISRPDGKAKPPATSAASAASSTSSSSSSKVASAASAAPSKQSTGALDEVEGVSISSAVSSFHKPGENYKTENYIVTPKTMELLAKHLKETGGKVFTRFPPEPNGILHIGHAKAMHINFTYAKVTGGHCYFRYDDTNPEKEEERFFTGIRQMVDWLGHEPIKTTYTSDYFQQLYDLAVVLVKKGLAYVCHQNEKEVREQIPSIWRERSVEENLKFFEDMRKGKFEEGKATLRMKHTMEDGKLDPVAYRVKFHEHVRTGDNWCIYPTYDYSHCLVDSMENITHSMCTKEFQNRRYSYYWLCNALDVYCPVQWEYGRLNINHTVMSKRKIQKLIEMGLVRDWDDPRLHTLMGLRRRGFPPKAINQFCEQIGVTMAQVNVNPEFLDSFVRDELNLTADRAMAVLDPIRVVIDNYDSLKVTSAVLNGSEVKSEVLPAASTTHISVVRNQMDMSRGLRSIPVGRVVYIDRSDFKEKTESGYRRLTPQQPVALKYSGLVLTYKNSESDASGRVTTIHVDGASLGEVAKPKAFITWVAESSECHGCAKTTTGSGFDKIEIRQIRNLFHHKNPEDKAVVPDGWLTDFNKDSMLVIQGAGVDSALTGAKVGDRFQFERFAFYVVDQDTTPSHLVLTEIVSLKEDSGK